MRFLCMALLACTLFLGACDMSGTKLAVVDVNKVLQQSPHAKQAQAEAAKAQEIYQYNLNVIEKVLAGYKDKKQAEGYLMEAARQLQEQLNASRAAVSGAMGTALQQEIANNSADYDMVLPKGNVLHVKDALDISGTVQTAFDKATVTWPPLPQRIDNPNLPADNKAEKKEDKKEEPKTEKK